MSINKELLTEFKTVGSMVLQHVWSYISGIAKYLLTALSTWEQIIALVQVRSFLRMVRCFQEPGGVSWRRCWFYRNYHWWLWWKNYQKKHTNIMTFQQICTNLRDFYLVKKGPTNLGISKPRPPPLLSGNARKLATFFNGKHIQR